MPRTFVLIFVLVLASYSIAHKVLIIPLTKQYISSAQLDNNVGVNLIDSVDSTYGSINQIYEGVNEEYAMDAPATYVYMYLFYCTMWFPSGDYNKQLRLVLDTKTPWLAASYDGCQGCRSHELLFENEVHD